MEKANQKLRNHMAECGVTQWHLGDALGKAEVTVTRMLRRELPDEITAQLIEAVDCIAAERSARMEVKA